MFGYERPRGCRALGGQRFWTERCAVPDNVGSERTTGAERTSRRSMSMETAELRTGKGSVSTWRRSRPRPRVFCSDRSAAKAHDDETTKPRTTEHERRDAGHEAHLDFLKRLGKAEVGVVEGGVPSIECSKLEAG